MRYTIENEFLRCEVDLHGAEVKSLVRKSDGREMMWEGNTEYWNRTSPVLFPFVGGVRDKEYRFEGQTYSIGQHGFARDKDFTLKSQEIAEIWFGLKCISPSELIRHLPFRSCQGSSFSYLIRKGSRYGNCFCFAACFGLMARAIGCEDVYCCNNGIHGWCEIGGNVYDPQWTIYHVEKWNRPLMKGDSPNYLGSITRTDGNWQYIPL